MLMTMVMMMILCDPGSADGTVRLWDLRKLASTKMLEGMRGAVLSCSLLLLLMLVVMMMLMLVSVALIIFIVNHH
jgi:hypothetical protein